MIFFFRSRRNLWNVLATRVDTTREILAAQTAIVIIRMFIAQKLLTSKFFAPLP